MIFAQIYNVLRYICELVMVMEMDREREHNLESKLQVISKSDWHVSQKR